jgi:hypothetical protein
MAFILEKAREAGSITICTRLSSIQKHLIEKQNPQGIRGTESYT